MKTDAIKNSDTSAETQATPPSCAPFPYADYRRAKTTLIRALSGPRFYAQVTAHSGMGKTSLLADIQTELDSGCGTVVYVSSSKATAQGVIRALSAALHLPAKMHYLESVRMLATAISSHQHPMLLWVDEAHAVDAQTLTELRMLAESAPGGRGMLFSTVFCGLASLRPHLEAPDLFPLRRRISIRCHLAGLLRDELQPFLRHRFGSVHVGRIDATVFDELFERTTAVPALIDAVVRYAGQLAADEGAISQPAIKQALDVYSL